MENKIIIINPLRPKSDQNQFSPKYPYMVKRLGYEK